MKPILLLMSLVYMVSGSVFAETYKCVENGRLTISDMPCPPSAVSTVIPSEPNDNARGNSSAEEMQRLKSKLETIQHERDEAKLTDEKAARAKAMREEEVTHKAEESSLEARNSEARKNNILKSKKKNLDEEREERERRVNERFFNKP